MKQLISLAIIITVLTSCNSKKDSAVVSEEKKAEPKGFILDSLLRYNSEAELIAAFGRENVGRDTIYYPEDDGLSVITTLYPGTNNEVEFDWTDDLSHVGLLHIQLHRDSSAWSSHGVKIGTTLNELIQLNGKDFTFSGFGGEGTLPDTAPHWNEGGKLSDPNFYIRLSITEIPENEMDSLFGNQTISSKSLFVRRVNPFVSEISLTSKE